MHILSIGINHDTAPVHIREQFAFNSASSASDKGVLAGLIILSTCNRVELYAASATKDFTVLEEMMAHQGDTNRAMLSKYLYHYADEAAIQHLMRVAAGLDSVVLGEPQILGQITRAMQSALDQKITNPILTKVFQQAIHTGKRVRSETSIARNPTSIAGVAVRLAAEDLPSLPSMQVAVLGAGTTASLVVGALRQRGVENLQVLNRTLSKAQELASFWGGSAHPLSELPSALQTSDLVISSIDARQPIVKTKIVADAMQFRPQRRLTVIDVAVPRNVAPETSKIPNVFLHNMDTLQIHLTRSVNLRVQEQSHAEKILSEEMIKIKQILREYEALPLISALYKHAETIRKGEVEKIFNQMEHLSEVEKNKIELMTRSMVKKLLHTPAKNLRTASHNLQTQNIYYADAVRKLLDLSVSKI